MQVERSRYKIMLEAFLEMGGSRNMLLSPSDIEIKVVNDLKLDEGVYVESFGDAYVRRRQKPSSVQKQPVGIRPSHDEMVSGEELLCAGSHTSHEDEVIDQTHGRVDFKVEDDSPVGHSEMMNNMQPIWPQTIKLEQGMLQARDDGIPLQNCEQMIRMSPQAQAAVYAQRRAG